MVRELFIGSTDGRSFAAEGGGGVGGNTGRTTLRSTS